MDVHETRFGTHARDHDVLALSVQQVFKRFLEEYSDSGHSTSGEPDLQSPSSPSRPQVVDLDNEMRDDATNDSFASAASRPRSRAAPHSQDEQQSKYAEEALKLLKSDRNTLFVDFKDIELFDSNLAEDIITDYYRFYPYLCRALAAYVREEKIRRTEADLDPDLEVAQRRAEREQIKKELDHPHIKNKNYYLGFYNFAQRDNIRELSSVKVGVLTRVTGQVVRTHVVHPELLIGCFKCKDCLAEQYTEQQFRYTPPSICTNENCANRSRFDLIIDKSRFTDLQRLRIQETQQELPRGCIPRSFDVVIRGTDQMECIQPGDQCDFFGTLIAIPDIGRIMGGTYGTVASEPSNESGVTGLKDLGVKEMTHSLAFMANACVIEGQLKPCLNTEMDERENALGGLNVADFTKEEILKIENMSKDPKLLDNLSSSLFSSIYGSEDVKRGILLQLLGGVTKVTPTGTKLRGDINICLVGDPSTAKSQFLKIVTDFAPVKAVYASGKASSASGLTAAVVRDTDGGFVIEAGALMLADRGICCIDEFDKMDLKDQVAIHEAMEQQTISITKAGVTATLNARASILAAANPIGGTYDRNRDLRSNLGLSLPIMSRFDLFFTIIDPRETSNDRAIASRILDMHLNYANSTNVRQNMMYSFEEIRLYLRFARKYFPKLHLDTGNVFNEEYVRLRSNSTRSKTSWRVTVRQMESLIRLSEAIARAHCDEWVRPDYVRLASRLIEKTIVHVGNAEVDLPFQDKIPSEAAEGADGDQQTQGMYDGEVESQRLESTQPTTQSEKMPLAIYKGMAEVFLLKLRKEAERDDNDSPAVRRSDLINWYLEQCVSEISNERELIVRKQLCEKVIDRLIKTDKLLMEIREDGTIADPLSPARDQVPASDEDRFIIINPNEDEELLDELGS